MLEIMNGDVESMSPFLLLASCSILTVVRTCCANGSCTVSCRYRAIGKNCSFRSGTEMCVLLSSLPRAAHWGRTHFCLTFVYISHACSIH